jgi:hypothetical protein
VSLASELSCLSRQRLFSIGVVLKSEHLALASALDTRLVTAWVIN